MARTTKQTKHHLKLIYKVKEGEYWWLHAPAIDMDSPLMIGQVMDMGGMEPFWYVSGRERAFNAGPGITCIKRIRVPGRKAIKRAEKAARERIKDAANSI